MSTRAGIYVRVSTDDQRDNGHSIDSQLRMLKEHCEKESYDIIDVYVLLQIQIMGKIPSPFLKNICNKNLWKQNKHL